MCFWWNTPFEICHVQELLHIRSYTFHYVFKIPGSVKIKICQILLQRITITSYLTVFKTNMGTTALTMVLIPVVWFLNPVSVIYYSKVIMQCKLDKVALPVIYSWGRIFVNSSVSSISVVGNSPLKVGRIVWPPVIQQKEKNLTKYWDLIMTRDSRSV